MRPFVARSLVWLALLLTVGTPAGDAGEPAVADVRAVHRDGQTFITWKDAAEGQAGAKFRYSVFRSERPITAENLSEAELCYRGVLNNSAKLFGSAFNSADRLTRRSRTVCWRKRASRCRPGADWPS